MEEKQNPFPPNRLSHAGGLVQADDQINILVTRIEQEKAGEITLKLMFLDPRYCKPTSADENGGRNT